MTDCLPLILLTYSAFILSGVIAPELEYYVEKWVKFMFNLLIFILEIRLQSSFYDSMHLINAHN